MGPWGRDRPPLLEAPWGSRRERMVEALFHFSFSVGGVAMGRKGIWQLFAVASYFYAIKESITSMIGIEIEMIGWL